MKKSQSYYWNIVYTSEKYLEFEGWVEAKTDTWLVTVMKQLVTDVKHSIIPKYNSDFEKLFFKCLMLFGMNIVWVI